MSSNLRVGLNAVIVAVTDEVPRVLTVHHEKSGLPAIPFGPLDPTRDRTLELSLRRWVSEQSGLSLGYVEQLYTFGDRDRDPHQDPDARVISVAYLALVREASLAGGNARWRDVYDFLPWEDRRDEDSRLLPRTAEKGLRAWARLDPRVRRERVSIAFGDLREKLDPERSLERYEILWEAGIAESVGRAMALDHRRMLATALGRLRGKIRYRPIVFELMPERFTLLALQKTVEALAGTKLHKQNFRRLLETTGLVEGTGETFSETGGRPAELYRFRRDVLRERPSTGVGYPRA